MAGNDCIRLEIAGFAGNGLTWLERACNVWEGWKRLEMAGNGLKWLIMIGSGWNGWIWLEMAGKC